MTLRMEIYTASRGFPATARLLFIVDLTRRDYLIMNVSRTRSLTYTKPALVHDKQHAVLLLYLTLIEYVILQFN